MENEKRNIWKNLFLALLSTPLASLIIIISITLIGAIDGLITKIQLAGFWWILPTIFGFIPSFIYFTYGSSFRINRERKETAKSLLLYWRDKLNALNFKDPSREDIEAIEKQFLDRIKIWAWHNPQSWKKHFPYEKYSYSLFGIVDNFIKSYKKTKSNKWSEFIWKTNLKSER